MEKRKDGRIVAIVALLISVVAISIGYAAMSTTLKITGEASMNTAKWSIKFANLSDPQVQGAGTVLTEPSLSDTLIEDYKIKLTKPGDSVSYTFDVVNGSDSMNAILGTYTKKTPVCTGSGDNATTDAQTVCNNLVYKLTYTDSGEEVKANDTLDANTTVNMTLTVGYEGTTLPTNDVSISDLEITMIYSQN